MSYIFQQLNNIMTGILIVITVFAALFFLIMYRSRKKKRVSLMKTIQTMPNLTGKMLKII